MPDSAIRDMDLGGKNFAGSYTMADVAHVLYAGGFNRAYPLVHSISRWPKLQVIVREASFWSATAIYFLSPVFAMCVCLWHTWPFGLRCLPSVLLGELYVFLLVVVFVCLLLNIKQVLDWREFLRDQMSKGSDGKVGSGGTP